MSHLDVPGHEGRQFKPSFLEGCPCAPAFLSLGDCDKGRAWHDHWALAVVLDEVPREAERQLFEDIVHLREPFVAAEVMRIGGFPAAIGFLPPRH